MLRSKSSNVHEISETWGTSDSSYVPEIVRTPPAPSETLPLQFFVILSVMTPASVRLKYTTRRWSFACLFGNQKLIQSGIATLFDARSNAAEPISCAPLKSVPMTPIVGLALRHIASSLVVCCPSEVIVHVVPCC